jgi:hypothetical protein
MTDRNLPDAPTSSTSPKMASLIISIGLKFDAPATPHHLIERHDTIEATTRRAMSRVRAHIARTGITGPKPLIA